VSGFFYPWGHLLLAFLQKKRPGLGFVVCFVEKLPLRWRLGKPYLPQRGEVRLSGTCRRGERNHELASEDGCCVAIGGRRAGLLRPRMLLRHQR